MSRYIDYSKAHKAGFENKNHIMKKENYGVIHQTAYCNECGKSNDNYDDQRARKWGYAHAKATGHKVTVETGTAFQYN